MAAASPAACNTMLLSHHPIQHASAQPPQAIPLLDTEPMEAYDNDGEDDDEYVVDHDSSGHFAYVKSVYPTVRWCPPGSATPMFQKPQAAHVVPYPSQVCYHPSTVAAARNYALLICDLWCPNGWCGVPNAELRDLLFQLRDCCAGPGTAVDAKCNADSDCESIGYVDAESHGDDA